MEGTSVSPAPLRLLNMDQGPNCFLDEWVHEWIKLIWMEVKPNLNEKNEHHFEDTLKNNFYILLICVHPTEKAFR